MSGRSSQRKGADGEKELSALLRREGFHTERGPSQSYGTTPDVSGLPGVHVEVKRVERLNLENALEQSERDAKKFQDGIPVVMHRRNRSPWRVSMNLTDWLHLYRAWRREDFSESHK
ncbi:MAG: hypothetical protein LUG44_11870 [Clostridiales bacterium]|nr:hypothetical protein [Clostridiales bacterium]